MQLVASAADVLRFATEESFDIVILDLNRPESSSLDVLKSLQAKKPDLPVLIVTAAAHVEQRVRGLDAGADDYIAKPFAFAELAARIRAVLRRGTRPAQAVLKVDDLELDRFSHSVHRSGHAVDL